MTLLNPEFLISMPGEMEWVWILLVVVILFGGKKLPELAKGLGKGIREFKDAKDGIQQEIEEGMKAENNEALTSKEQPHHINSINQTN